MSNLRNKGCIVGVGETELGKLPDISQMGLNLRAARRALADAGLKNTDVDGVLTAQSGCTFIYSLEVANNLGIQPRFTNTLEVGGATPISMVQTAIMAIDAGLCEVCLCVYGEKQRTLRSIKRHAYEPLRGYHDFDWPYGLPGAPGVHAMACRRHMHEYGTTRDQMGAVAVAMRRHASLNANAQRREPITLEDYRNSPPFVEPFLLLDICQVTDGAGAVVVTSAERARHLTKPPVYIAGMGQAHHARLYCNAETLTTLGARASGRDAFRMAGLSPRDVDVAELYDCFTIVVLMELEDYGFCAKGEAGAFAAGGRIEIGGELPVNTHGGLLSQGHVDGMLHIVEGVRQLRGGEVEPERQVPGAEICLVSGHGGNLSTHASLVLSKNPV